MRRWRSGCGGDNKDASSSGKSEHGAAAGKSGKFTDDRDGQKYKTVKIGNQTWMAENLRFKVGDSWCYGNDESNCQKYGRLYDWNMAKVACPKGWHLPSENEWTELVTVVGSETGGKKLKSASGWNENGNGTDDFGFSALPGGYRSYSDETFEEVGESGIWWTSTDKYANPAGKIYAYHNQEMDYDSDGVGDFNKDNGDGLSVRCVKRE